MLNSEYGSIKVKSECEKCPTGTYSAENNNKNVLPYSMHMTDLSQLEQV